MENSLARDEDLDYVCRCFEEYDTSTLENRQLQERDRDYVDHKQWTPEDAEVLRQRGQQPSVNNRITPKINFMLGLERSTRTDPKAWPRTPKHEDGANAVTDALRFVNDQDNFDVCRSNVFEGMIVEGVGGAEVIVKNTKKGVKITTVDYPPDRIFYDIHRRRKDYKDCKYKGLVVWMDYDDAKKLGNEDAVNAALSDTSGNQTHDDVPRTAWIDSNRKRIRVFVIYYLKDDVWMYAKFTKGGFIEGPTPSPYLDENDDPECPIELQSVFIDRDGNCYGQVRTWIETQDSINKRESKALHLLNSRQTIGEKGAVADVNAAKRELAKPDGHVEVTPGMRFEIVPTNDLASGNFEMLRLAKDDIDAVGVNAAMAGKDSREMSGRALEMRSQSGGVEIGPITDALRQWQKRVYTQQWHRIRQFWTAETWIRVTDDENNLKWVGLNKPVTAGDKIAKEFGGIPPEMAGDPRLAMPVEVENNVVEMDVDFTVSAVPDTLSIQSEQFELLSQMYQADPEKIPFDLVIEASQLRNKQQLLERIRGNPKDNEKRQAEMEQKKAEAEEIAKAAAVTKIEVDKSTAERNKASAIKLKAEAADTLASIGDDDGASN